MKILKVQALEVFDSSGTPTVEVHMELGNEFKQYKGSSVVPSGYFNSKNSAKELRDKDRKIFEGKGVAKAVNNINTFIAKALFNQNFKDISELDNYLIMLDGTQDKSNLGSNALLGISIAYLKAISNYEELKPYQYIAKKFKTNISMPRAVLTLHQSSESKFIKELAVTCLKSDRDFRTETNCVIEIYHRFKHVVQDLDLLLNFEEKIFDTLKNICTELKYDYQELGIILTVPEYNEETAKYLEGKNIYAAKFENKKPNRSKISNIKYILGEYSAEEDYATDGELIEINKIGTVTEIIELIKKFKAEGKLSIATHSQADTEETIVSDISVGAGCEFMKFNSLNGAEVTSNLNQLLRIERTLIDPDSIYL